ncbi:hypothetical protein DH86_00002668, partial [Scytalidium sp. 3C]
MQRESVPVSKIPANDESLRRLNLAASSIAPDVARHFLFCGTKIIRARRPQDDKDDEAVGLAMAVRTGFDTTKGALVRSMLFPKPSGFKFYRDSFRYISVMGGVAILGFIVSFVNFVRLQLAWHLIIVRALDLITIVVPPALPATLTIGTNFALTRLRKKQIFCISPQRVNVGGKLDVVCFDKTGTLTEDGLDVLGIRVVQKPGNHFSDIFPDASSLLPSASYERDPTVSYDAHKAILHTMTTCHSLRVVDNELVGDPLDVKMFEFTGWNFEEGEQKSDDLEDEEQSGLSPSIARPPPGMEYETDIPQDANGRSDINKRKSPIELGILKSFDFVSQLRRASVIVRKFGSQGVDIFVKGAPECMKDICKPESCKLLVLFNVTHVDHYLVPSDYEELLTYYTHRGFRVIACATRHVTKLNWVKVQKMKREEAESDLEFIGFIIFENKLKPTTAGPLAPPAEGDASLPYDISNLRNYSLAISGDVFRWVVDFAAPDVLQRMLVCGQVFARMSPDEKHELVEKLQSIDYCCGFCGDGANDCGALKAADVVGWTGPYPFLCRKRPTANLVSRKVLVPLLGQIAICVLIQAAGFITVRRQSWYIPPHLDREKSNIENSENTTLFLISCYEYILSGIVLSVGPPFRQSLAHNLPFVITIVVSYLFSTYMVFDP